MEASSSTTSPAIGPRAIATPSAKEALLIANTPAFLLERLRKDIAVQYVLDSMSAREIVQMLTVALARPPREASELVPLYVYLVALSSADPGDQELWKQIRALDLSHLEWGEAIRRLIYAAAVPTTTLEVSLSSPARP
jgi:hypothetical protein